MNKIIILTITFFFTFTSNAQNKLNTKFGKGIINATSKDSSWSMKFGLRFQTLFTESMNINDSTGLAHENTQFQIRRARIKFDGYAFSPKLKYKLELGVSNRDLGKATDRANEAPRMILDAVLKWNFYQNFVLWAGQTKLPGNRERVVSSANMQLVDRSMLNSEFNIDRDMGFQLHHRINLGKQFIIKEAFAFSQGEGRNLVQENLGGFQYTSRLEFLPFGDFASKGDYFGSDLKREQKPKLAIGATFDYNDRAVLNRSNQGSYMSIDRNLDGEIDGYVESTINTWFIDMMFKYKGFSFMGEFADRSTSASDAQHIIINDDFSTSTFTVRSGRAINLQAGYLFKNNWEIAGRYTQVSPKAITGRKMQQQFTLGLSKFIVGHSLKVQTDISYLKTQGSADSGLLYRLQFDIHF